MSWITETWQSLASGLDRGGRPAWFGASILGFILFWPLGLFFLANTFMRGNTMCGRNKRYGSTSTGNTAFDRYRDETIARLQEERQAFNDYMQRLREARDQEEFDGWTKEYKAAQKA